MCSVVPAWIYFYLFLALCRSLKVQWLGAQLLPVGHRAWGAGSLIDAIVSQQ